MRFLMRLTVCVLFACGVRASACTTAVVSGKATADGRPILWKNRDAPERNNRVVYYTGEGHAYLAVVNAGASGSVWMGVNDKGFCIENSVVKDMPRGGGGGLGNGTFMRLALVTCSTVKEFEALLKRTNESGRSTQANYGVIDAEGGAAIFETGHASFVKFDANDPAVAPLGYVVRSNFTMTGTGNDKLKDGGDLLDIYSGERYVRAESLFRAAVKAGRLDHRYVLRHLSRDLADEKCRPFSGTINGDRGDLPETIDTASTLSRRTTVSVGVFHGVKPGEDPLLTTMWTMLGEPAFAVAVPCWVRSEGVAATLKGDKLSPLCSTTLALRESCYDEAKKLLRTSSLPGLWARTWKLEDALLREADERIAGWREKSPDREEVRAFHTAAALRVMELLSELREKAAVPVGAKD